MQGLSYLGLLMLSISGMLLLDWRYSLAFFYNPKRTATTLLLATGVFVVWDIGGIALGIFLAGDSPYATGMRLGPQFPIEELVFLSFFCYLTLLLYRLIWKMK